MRLSNKVYDVLKWVVMVALPATEALWLTLGNIWGFPLVVEIGSTIAAVTVFLGALLGISNYNYKKDAQTQLFNEDLLKDMVGYFDGEFEETEEEGEE